MAEKIDLKALAKLFGMNVSQLARFMGYTKQALYQLNDGTSGICTERYYAALKQLQHKNQELYEADLQEAHARKQEREKHIRQMCRNVSAINVIEQVEYIRKIKGDNMIAAEFGKGNVLITPSVNESFEKGCIILQNGKGTGEVGGEKSTEGFSVSDEDIILTFENIASVDVLIRNLEKLKKMMNGDVDGCRMIGCEY